MNRHDPPTEIVDLPHVEMLEITELSPYDGTLISKRIEHGGKITPYPDNIRLWRQAVVPVHVNIAAVFDYLCEARKPERNIILIRDTPANLAREVVRRLKAFEYGRGDYGFVDKPSRLFFIDIDGALISWRDDPEGAVKRLVAEMPEPWASASYVWFFTASHGLETETVGPEGNQYKQWTGEISDGKVYVRLAFILDRALDCAEARQLTLAANAGVSFKIDEAISRRVQINYIQRPLWVEHPDRDPLGEIPTIGLVRGKSDIATVPPPEILTLQVRWSNAQGHDAIIANHPDALSAVLGIGSNGRVREHMLAAIVHLLKANPLPDLVSHIAHGHVLAAKLAAIVGENEDHVRAQLAVHGRPIGDVTTLLPDNMALWAVFAIVQGLDRLRPRQTVKLVYEARAAEDGPSAKKIFDRVKRTIKGAKKGVTLLIAPPGTRKSTLMRAKAVERGRPEEPVVILVPRIKLGDEQVEAIYREHPDKMFTAKVRRGLHQDDPEFIGPQHPDKLRKMCWRDEEATELEKHLLSVKDNLCKKGKVKCAFLQLCGSQRQEKVMADVWFAAHEMIVHEIPKVFGNVDQVMIDENSIGVFVFGTDDNAPFELDLDTLKYVPSFIGSDDLMDARLALYNVLDEIPLSGDPHIGVPVSRELLQDFIRQPGHLTPKYNPWQMAKLEWDDKVEPAILPSMNKREINELLEKAEGNPRILRLATMWKLIAKGGDGHIQIYTGKHGRVIRMFGLREIAKDWKGLPTLICDGTGDATLYRAIWPKLKCKGGDDWRQLPRPEGVRVFQCVDKALSKYMIAIEDEGAKLATRERAARRLWGAVLAKAAEYGGQDVGVIIYKSTRKWIEKNCFVADWITLAHHGAVTGSNKLSKVRALFVIGRTLVPAETVTRQTEALFGDYIPMREYRKKPKQGRIPIPPNAAGDNTVLVDVWEHPHPLAERVRRQGTEGQGIQNAERARAGLRGPGSPLDIHLWNNVPLPELGEVEPGLWDEQNDGLDAVMWAAGGVWLENISHAVEAYDGLFSARALEWVRKDARTRGVHSFPIGIYNRETVDSSHCTKFRYQLVGKGQKPAIGVGLRPPDDTKAWLEARLGKLVLFELAAPPKAEAAE